MNKQELVALRMENQSALGTEYSAAQKMKAAPERKDTADPKEAAGEKPEICLRCGRELTPDEVGLTRKMVSRGARSFFCLSCLAGHFQVDEDTLRTKIREFREMGCTLFPPIPPL